MGHLLHNVLLMTCLLMVNLAESQNGNCTYRGTIYQHLATFKHENRCSKLQCQFGQIVVTYAACGTNLDGTCHPLGHLFEYNNLTYQCQNTSQPVDAGPFKYKETRVNTPGCFTEQTFVTPSRGWEAFNTSPCGGFQCQNGHIVQLDQICQTGFQDKPCRLVGEQFLRDDSILECTATQDNGTTTYRNKVVYLKPFKGKTCILNNKTIGHLAVRNDWLTCREYQCQNGTLKVLKIRCRNTSGDRQCLMIGERYLSLISSNGWRQCVLDPETGEPRIVVTKDVFQRCQLTSQVWLDHLEQGISPDGCSRVQCQNGVLVELEAGCYSEAHLRCYYYKLIWKQKNKTKTCGLSPSATIVDISGGKSISEPPGEWKKINGTI